MVRAAAGRNVWIVGGGDLAGQFADAGLLDEVLVTIAPVTLGAGAPLLPRRLELRLEETGATAISPPSGSPWSGRDLG
jgi:dihydrofolate reductase